MDNSHTTLVSLIIQNEALEEYTCDKNITLGINVESLAKIMKSVDNDSSVTLQRKSQKDEVLTILCESPKRTIKFGLRLVDIDSEDIEIPEIDSDCSVEFNSSDFGKMVKDFCALEGDSLTFDIKKDRMTLKCESNLCSTEMTICSDNNSEDMNLTCKKPYSASFDLKHLNDFTKSGNLSDKVQLSFTEGNPVIVSYTGEACQIKYYLAPKIGEEGEDESEERNVKKEESDDDDDESEERNVKKRRK